MRLLALVPGGIGNQILVFPMFDTLKRVFPKAEIDVVVEPQAKAAYRVCKLVGEVFLYDFQTRNSPADWANLLGIIRDREFEAVISFCNSGSIGLMLWLSGIPNRIGYANSVGQFGLTRTVPLKSEQYLAHQYHDLLAGLDITAVCPDLTINVPQADIAWADQTRDRLGLKGSGYVLVYPGSVVAEGKKAIEESYPTESWVPIIQDFQSRQPNLPVVVLQTRENGAQVTALLEAIPGTKTMRSDNVGQAAAAIAGADLMLCTEGYPMQLAIALKVFTLALFGSGSPTQLLPQSSGSDTRFLGITSPSGALADIAPSTVLAKVWGG